MVTLHTMWFITSHTSPSILFSSCFISLLSSFYCFILRVLKPIISYEPKANLFFIDIFTVEPFVQEFAVYFYT